MGEIVEVNDPESESVRVVVNLAPVSAGTYWKPGDAGVGEPRQARLAFRQALLAVAPEVLAEFRATVDPLYVEWAKNRTHDQGAAEFREADGGNPYAREFREAVGAGWYRDLTGPLYSDEWDSRRKRAYARWRDLSDGDPAMNAIRAAVVEWTSKYQLDYDWIVAPALSEVLASWPRPTPDDTPLKLGDVFAGFEDVHKRLEIPDLLIPAWDPLGQSKAEYASSASDLVMEYLEEVGAGLEAKGYVERTAKRGIDPERTEAAANETRLRHYRWLATRLVRPHKSRAEIAQGYDVSARAVTRAMMLVAEECGVNLDHVGGPRTKNRVL